MDDAAQISITADDQRAIVVGGGALDLTNSEEFHDGLRKVSETLDDVTVDLREAFFIDTAVVQDLARAAVVMLKRGARLKVMARGTAYPLRVLRISGLESIIDFEVEQ
jgi:anti-anti-sigma factor